VHRIRDEVKQEKKKKNDVRTRQNRREKNNHDRVRRGKEIKKEARTPARQLTKRRNFSYSSKGVGTLAPFKQSRARVRVRRNKKEGHFTS